MGFSAPTLSTLPRWWRTEIGNTHDARETATRFLVNEDQLTSLWIVHPARFTNGKHLFFALDQMQ
jgi:hypothetical protein